MKSKLATIATGIIIASAANAEIVQVDVVGTVDFGMLPGVTSWGSFGVGDDVVMSFQVDSDNFVDSMMFPVRGYEIIQPSFSLAINNNAVGLALSQPSGSPYFAIRNDDPAVDGFFLGTDVDGFPNGVATDEPANLADTFSTLFQATYEGTRLDSLDILDAVGTYDFTGLSVFNWGLEDLFVQPVGFIFDQWTISVVPTPASLVAIAPLGLITTRRRR